MLRTLLPRIVGERSFQVYAFQCKEDLLARLLARLRGYAAWLPENYRVVVILDRDDDDCFALKRSIEEIAAEAGLLSRTRAAGNTYQIVNRLAIEELEAWFFGDWEAVCQAYPKLNPHVCSRRGFRDPDQIAGGTWEALQRLLQRSGYYRTGMPKIETARTIAEHMEPERNMSTSFRCLKGALDEIIAAI